MTGQWSMYNWACKAILTQNVCKYIVCTHIYKYTLQKSNYTLSKHTVSFEYLCHSPVLSKVSTPNIHHVFKNIKHMNIKLVS